MTTVYVNYYPLTSLRFTFRLLLFLFFYQQGMFFPQLFGIVGEKLVYTKDHQYDDPEDLYDDRYLLEVRTCSAHGGVIHFPFFPNL